MLSSQKNTNTAIIMFYNTMAYAITALLVVFSVTVLVIYNSPPKPVNWFLPIQQAIAMD
jgi:hypothetical protein